MSTAPYVLFLGGFLVLGFVGAIFFRDKIGPPPAPPQQVQITPVPEQKAIELPAPRPQPQPTAEPVDIHRIPASERWPTATRKVIFWERWAVTNDARIEAKRRSNPLAPYDKVEALQLQIRNQYMRDFQERWNIRIRQIDEIEQEGEQKFWPQP